MSYEDKLSSIPESNLLETLDTQPTIETSVLSSTRIQDQQTDMLNNLDRRKTIIPDSHKPKSEQDLVMINKDNDLPFQEQKSSENDKQNSTREKIKIRFNIDESKNDSRIKDMNISTSVNSIRQQETIDGADNLSSHGQIKNVVNSNLKQKIDNNDNEEDQVTNENENDDDNFDSFVLQNFVPYSGKENVISWLDATEEKFNRNCIGRRLRFAAISLLVEGVAKQKYIRRRKEIRSYDDFYEFLLTEFENTDDTIIPFKSCQTANNQTSILAGSDSMKSAIESNQCSFNNSKTLNLTSQVPLLSSTTVANVGVTASGGEIPVVNTSTVSSSLSNSMLDSTFDDIRKAIVGDLIKHPKVFRGGKEDVNKWIEEIEHLLDLAHIPESTRLNLISYSLRGDALEWFKNNRTSFNSWTVFVVELKRAFTSSFQGELAFKKLESYSQGENQSIRSFFNEVLKLCKEADTSMSEATKLKHLLSKTKPSIQFEVRKKKPATPKEFFEFAKEAEELIQLSNMTTDTVSNQTTTQSAQPSLMSSFQSTQPFSSNRSFQHPSYHYSSNNFRNSNKDNRVTQNRNTYFNRNSSSFSNNKTPQNQFGYNSNSSQFQRRQFSNDSVNKNSKNAQTSRNAPLSNARVPHRSVNTIDTQNSFRDTETSSDTLVSSYCNKCQKFGHETSVCPNF